MGKALKNKKKAEGKPRAQCNKGYTGFRGLVLAELDEFGPRGLSFKAKLAKVPFYFRMRADVFFKTFC